MLILFFLSRFASIICLANVFCWAQVLHSPAESIVSAGDVALLICWVVRTCCAAGIAFVAQESIVIGESVARVHRVTTGHKSGQSTHCCFVEENLILLFTVYTLIVSCNESIQKVSQFRSPYLVIAFSGSFFSP